MLAVFPHGYAFVDSDLGVLLNHDAEVVTATIPILEQWAAVRADPSNCIACTTPMWTSQG